MKLQLIDENYSVLCSIIFHLGCPLTYAKSLFVFLFVSFGKFGHFTQGLLANLLLFICLFLYSLCLALLSRRGAGAGKMVGEQRTKPNQSSGWPCPARWPLSPVSVVWTLCCYSGGTELSGVCESGKFGMKLHLNQQPRIQAVHVPLKQRKNKHSMHECDKHIEHKISGEVYLQSKLDKTRPGY